jgi:hypothetical protein
MVKQEFYLRINFLDWQSKLLFIMMKDRKIINPFSSLRNHSLINTLDS